MVRYLLAVLCLLLFDAREYRPGVWLGRSLTEVPLPVEGYDLYMLGEVHGVGQNVTYTMAYAALLHREAGLRDIALEEKPVYEPEAQAYVHGQAAALPAELCLRVGILRAMRDFNASRAPAQQLNVHLVDIDINADAIHEHLLRIEQRIGASRREPVPDVTSLKRRGLQTVAAFERRTPDRGIRAELRTLRHSIRALQQGLSVGEAGVKGSPYLDDREDAITSNLLDLLNRRPARPVLALYGADHIAKNVLHNGGPKQDRDFAPAAMRLTSAGVRVFSLAAIPLNGKWSWRGRGGDLMWTAQDGGLSNGDNFATVLASAPGSTLLFVDPRKERARMPTSDLTRSGADGFLLFADALPAQNYCGATTRPI